MKTKNITIALISSLIITSSAFSYSSEKKSYKAKAPEANIVETAVAAGNFQTLVAAVQAAGLGEALSGEGPLTVFAPTDKAFAALPAGTVENLLKPENKDQLVDILTYHVVGAKVKSYNVESGDVTMLNEKTAEVIVDGDNIMIDGANVVTADIVTSNGVIHVIDSVILPNS